MQGWWSCVDVPPPNTLAHDTHKNTHNITHDNTRNNTHNYTHAL